LREAPLITSPHAPWRRNRGFRLPPLPSVQICALDLWKSVFFHHLNPPALS